MTMNISKTDKDENNIPVYCTTPNSEDEEVVYSDFCRFMREQNIQ